MTDRNFRKKTGHVNYCKKCYIPGNLQFIHRKKIWVVIYRLLCTHRTFFRNPKLNQIFTPSLLPPQSNLLHSRHCHSSAHLPFCPASRIKHSLSKPAKVSESVFALLNDIYTANFSVDRTGPVTEWTSPRLMYALEIFYFVAHRSLIDG